jgi:hypothetical protein
MSFFIPDRVRKTLNVKKIHLIIPDRGEIRIIYVSIRINTYITCLKKHIIICI